MFMEDEKGVGNFAYSFEFEERLAAKFCGYTIKEYKELKGDEKSDVIATYREVKLFEAVQAALQAREHKKAGR
jgi:hypothetical protein